MYTAYRRKTDNGRAAAPCAGRIPHPPTARQMTNQGVQILRYAVCLQRLSLENLPYVARSVTVTRHSAHKSEPRVATGFLGPEIAAHRLGC